MIEGFWVEAAVDLGSDIIIILAKFFKSFATSETKGKFSSRFHPVDRRFFSYGRDEIGFLKVWLPLWTEFDGKGTFVPVVIDEVPECDCGCVFGSPSVTA